MNNPQVERSHYAFQAYMTPYRWASTWHQIDLSLQYAPLNVLEVGSGPGVYKTTLVANGVSVTSLDIAEDLKPDVVGSVLDLPFENGCFDLSCAFQVLEHLPNEFFIPALKELRRVARKAVILSLPDAAAGYPTRISIPGRGIFDFILPRPYLKKVHVFDGEHYWEINKKETPLDKVLEDITIAGLSCKLCQRYPDNIYHRFFVLE